MRRLERRALRQASPVFALSCRDVEWVREHARSARLLSLGRVPSAQTWKPSERTEPVFVFAGAMWRDPNIRAAKFLIDEVMPEVWKSAPRARLRIVGARPDATLAHYSHFPFVEIVSEVPSFALEYADANAVVAISLVDAGVLVKAISAFECAAPVVMNGTVAASLGALDGVHSLVCDDPREIATALVRVWQDNRVPAKSCFSRSAAVRRVCVGCGRDVGSLRRCWFPRPGVGR